MKRIFITGGHFTPAKAVIDKLRQKEDWEIFYLGRRYAMEADKAPALEYQELSGLSYLRYLSITTGRLQRKFFVNVGQSLKSLLKIPLGFLQAFWWLLKYRPGVVLSFGGYVAVPVAIGAWFLGIPVLTHEQTFSLGLANRIIRLFAKKVLMGNPLREEFFQVKSRPTNLIFVTGGNQGAHAINLAVEEIVAELSKKYEIIHQTGDSSYRDFERLVKKQNQNYTVRKFLNSREMARTLARAKLVISRSGANTITELAYLGKPAILIPIPWSEGSEQEKNAQSLVDLGMAELLPQEGLCGKSLSKMVEKMTDSYDVYQAKALEAKQIVIPNAAELIVDELEKVKP